jgi:hypothetical protein
MSILRKAGWPLVAAAVWTVGYAQGQTLAVEPLTSPAGASSSVPQMTTEGDRAVLSWVEQSGKSATLKFAERTLSGWSDPRVVVSNDRLMVNSSDVPSVRAMPDGTLAAHWMEQHGADPEAYDLRVAWSTDGRQWSVPVAPNRDTTVSQHGFATLFPTVTGGLGLVWLDGRTTHGDEGDMQLRAATFNKDHKLLSDTAIATRVCECCPTSVAIGSRGPIAAYRNRSVGEIRDVYVTRLDSGRWSTPVSVHQDNFKIDGCPINGPSIAARDQEVVVAWFTAPDDNGQSFVAFSRDGGRTFGKATRVDEVESQGRVSVGLQPDGSAIVGWVELGKPVSQFRIRRIDVNGKRGPAFTVATVTGTRIPHMVLVRSEAVFAWTEVEKESTRVQTARIRLGPN